MIDLRLNTKRLELIAGTLELTEAEINDRSRFRELLGAHVSNWPPPLNDENSMRFFRDFLARNPDAVGWTVWYFILRGQGEGRTAIGNGGFKGKPSAEGSIEVGYSVLERFHRQGYATEAVRALVSWAFEHPEVRCVIAETGLTPSLRLLEKIGFRPTGRGPEEGAIRYELSREDFLDLRRG